MSYDENDFVTSLLIDLALIGLALTLVAIAKDAFGVDLPWP